MKRSRYSPEQVAFGLRQAEEGHAGCRGLSEDGHQRADLLPLEESSFRGWAWPR